MILIWKNNFFLLDLSTLSFTKFSKKNCNLYVGPDPNYFGGDIFELILDFELKSIVICICTMYIFDLLDLCLDHTDAYSTKEKSLS